MTTTSNVTSPSSSLSALLGASGGTGAANATDDAATSDRFLKLLVAQMQNQDPLNPMDNAQVTTQMAQISTVSGIGELNKTVSGLNSQFAQVQSLSATSLIGHDVWLQGSTMQMTDAGTGQGAFQLAGVANRVQVQVLDGNNKVLDTLELGAQTAGRHEFDWSNTDYAGKAVSFKVTATQNDTAVTSTPLMLDKVESVGIDDNTLTLALSRSGDVPYSKVLAVH